MSRYFTHLAIATVALGTISLGAQARYTPQDRYNQDRYEQDRYEQDRYDFERRDTFGEELPAFVSVVDGYAELDRGGQSSRDIENVPLEAGDRLRTTRGRVEVLFEDGSVIALDEHTAIAFVTDGAVDLHQGRLRAQWRDRGSRDGLTIRTMAGDALIRTQGDYRITLGASRRGEPEIEVAVARGSAELANDLGRTLVREGTRALTTAAYAPSVPYDFSAPRDEFERWTDSLDDDRYGIESARYLPTELRYYGGVFDRYGAWHHHASYGWVWYPRVSFDWRPYSGGRWSFVVGFGYSWVGGSRWSWPTHHYGRWDRLDSNWFWIPARPTQHRFVGYAAPRPSSTSTVSYYQRTRTVQGPTFRVQEPRSPGVRGSGGPGVPGFEPRAVPRNQAPRTDAPRPQADRPQVDRPGRSEQPQRAAPPRRSAPPDRSSQPQRAAPTPRSEAPRASSPPPSGSRTPSRSANPSGGDTRQRSGTAVRRGGGGV